MKARAKLQECLNCRHNVECWGLNHRHPEMNPEKFGITFQSRLKLAVELITHKYTLRDFYGWFVSMYVRSTLYGNAELWQEASQTSTLVIEALTNSTIDRWECPSEYSFEPMEVQGQS